MVFYAGFHRQVAAAKDATTLRFMKRRGGSDAAEDVKQGSVRRYLEIEVEKTVNEDTDATEQCGGGQSSGGVFRPILQLGGRSAENLNQKPDGNAESYNARLDEQLQVIVMSLIDKEG